MRPPCRRDGRSTRIEDGVTGLLEPRRHPAALRAALEQLFTEEGLRASPGPSGARTGAHDALVGCGYRGDGMDLPGRGGAVGERRRKRRACRSRREGLCGPDEAQRRCDAPEHERAALAGVGDPHVARAKERHA